MTQAATIVRIGLKETETNRPWNWRLTVPKTNQDDASQTTNDQFQDDCQNWLLFLHVAPSFCL